MKRMTCSVFWGVAFTVIADITLAEEEFIFPVGLWVTDMNGYDQNMTGSKRVDLRSRGIEMILIGNEGGDVARLKKQLAMADSFGFKVYAVPSKFQELAYYGHDDSTNPTNPYFWQNDQKRFTASAFDDSLDFWVSSVVDSLKGYRSLYRYLFWDEPFHSHYKWITQTSNPWDDYWKNIWQHSDTIGLNTDSLGVYTLLKQKIETRDTLHSVWINHSGARKYAVDKEPFRGFCLVKFDTIPNPPHQIGFDNQIFVYSSVVGDTIRLHREWTEPMDSIVAAAKNLNPINPPPTYTTQLQSWGTCDRGSTPNLRITIPEEVKELANLAVLHEVKGIMHFVLPSFVSGVDSFANLWDEDFVPYDASYEEYVYNRDHSFYSPPDSLRPFNTNNPAESLYTDPFRLLPPRPTDSLNNPKYLEEFYQWKYSPYARNYNSMTEVNNSLHIIGNELLNLWETNSVVDTIIPDSGGIIQPEIVTFSPIDTAGITDNYNIFIVNKDLTHSEMGFTIRIDKNSLLPSLQNALILDLSDRHLINRTINPIFITFKVTLGAGEGKLVRLMQGTEIADAMVADPDIVFGQVKGGLVVAPLYEFTEGDTIQLSVAVYNLGFKPVDILGVNFYDGPVVPQNLIGMTSVSLPPLVLGDTIPKIATASINWATDTVNISPHDIQVLVIPISDVPERGGNNEAHMTLLIHPLDYAMKVVGNPWDMNERIIGVPGQPSTEDIAFFSQFTESPDSISSLWEAKMDSANPNPTPNIHLRITTPIDSSYNQLSFRFIQDPGGTPQTNMTGTVGWLGEPVPWTTSFTYTHGKWNLVKVDLMDQPTWRQVVDLWIILTWRPGKPNLFKLAWVKLETKT